MMRKIVLILLLPIVHLSAMYNKHKPLEERYRQCQRWCKIALSILGLELIVYNKQYSNIKGAYLVSNHQGTIDPLLIVASSQQALTFVSKASNRNILGIGKWGELLDLIYFDRNSKQGNIYMLRQTIRFLTEKRNVLIFPEGTRSKSDHMNAFKGASFKPAYIAKCDIVPITLNQSYALDSKLKVKQLSITYHKPIPYEKYKDLDMDTLANVVYDHISSAIQPIS